MKNMQLRVISRWIGVSFVGEYICNEFCNPFFASLNNFCRINSKLEWKLKKKKTKFPSLLTHFINFNLYIMRTNVATSKIISHSFQCISGFPPVFFEQRIQPADSIDFFLNVFLHHIQTSLAFLLSTTNFRDLMIRFPWSMNVKSMRDSGSESTLLEEERISLWNYTYEIHGLAVYRRMANYTWSRFIKQLWVTGIRQIYIYI